jgi:hypothetical protein
MSLAPFGGKKVGCRADRIHQLADSRDSDLDLLPRHQRDVVGRNQTGARQQNAACGDGILAHHPHGKLIE